jgi:Holliday junction resolvasome RuvABC ATP-dependent DNA helicase subunit
MFKDIIGQQEVKDQLEELALGSFVEFGFVPPVLFLGPKGVGKTFIAEAFSHELQDAEGLPRRCLVLNSSTVKSPKYFFEQVYPALQRIGSCGLLFDESHELDKDVQTLFLSVLNPKAGVVRRLEYKQVAYEFDLSNISFMFATTDMQKMLPPLVNRLTTVALRDYNKTELGLILAANLSNGIRIKDGMLDIIAPTLRGNARAARLRAEEISRYCNIRNKTEFTEKDWPVLCRVANILPFGLNQNEATVLKLLAMGPKSLQTIAACTGQSPSMIRLGLEPMLIRAGLMRIGEHSIREITPDGMDACKKMP